MCNNSQLVRLIECKQRSKSTESVRSNVALETKTNQREKKHKRTTFLPFGFVEKIFTKEVELPPSINLCRLNFEWKCNSISDAIVIGC